MNVNWPYICQQRGLLLAIQACCLTVTSLSVLVILCVWLISQQQRCESNAVRPCRHCGSTGAIRTHSPDTGLAWAECDIMCCSTSPPKWHVKAMHHTTIMGKDSRDGRMTQVGERIELVNLSSWVWVRPVISHHSLSLARQSKALTKKKKHWKPFLVREWRQSQSTKGLFYCKHVAVQAWMNEFMSEPSLCSTWSTFDSVC